MSSEDLVIKDSPAYLVLDGSFVIDAPVDVAWPCVINFPKWQGFTTCDREIEGTLDQEWEVFRLFKEEPGFKWGVPYYARTLYIDPQSRIVWKTFPTDVPEGTGFFGIVDFRVEPTQDGKTLYSYHFIYEFNGPFASDDERREHQQFQYNNFVVLMSSIGPKLVKFVESVKAAR